MKYIFLLAAIVCEVAATSSLKASDQFTKLWPSLATVIGYGMAFYFLSLTLRTMPVGIAYAMWSGIGIVLVAIIGVIFFKQSLDWPAIVGMAFIITGALIMNLLSKSASH